jgi:hypothetical protein
VTIADELDDMDAKNWRKKSVDLLCLLIFFYLQILKAKINACSTDLTENVSSSARVKQS